MDKLVSLCKRRGYIFPGSDIYGGLASFWDYGPLGVELKRNIKNYWWQTYVLRRDDIEGVDTAILMHPSVWEASGHVEGFSDSLVECSSCKKRFRPEDLSWKDQKKNVKSCASCGALIDLNEQTPRSFNLLFKTWMGPVEKDATQLYLRPETAQGIFVNFINILNTRRPVLPFGIAQIGKAFRNEVTVGNFIFRTREFEQMEIEYFVKPDEAQMWHKEWVKERYNWYVGMGIKKENLRIRPHKEDELAHYAKACSDIEYKFPFGWSELEGIANRGDYDLRKHVECSNKDFSYTDRKTKEKFLPYIIEPSGGVDRTVLAVLSDSYREETVKGKQRRVLSLNPLLAPYKVAVLPLLSNRDDLVGMAKKLTSNLREDFSVMYDDTVAIGKLYRRQDEIGTPFCVTVDVQSLEDKMVTVRERDTMHQDRVSVDKISEYLKDRLIKK